MKDRVPGPLSELWQAARLPLALIGSWAISTLCVALAATSRSGSASSLLLLAGFAALLAPLAYALAVNASPNAPMTRKRRLFWWLFFSSVFVASFVYSLTGYSTARIILAIVFVIFTGLVLANRLGRG